MDVTITDVRKALRRQIQDARDKLSPEETAVRSARITARLEELQPIKNARVIMGFSSIKNEVTLAAFLEKLQGQGKIILLPRVEENGIMNAVQLQSFKDTQTNAWGIKEPAGSPYDPRLIDVVLVPGLAFDLQGYRLGYGRGYYDRFLPRLRPDAFICGICYGFQIVNDTYPQEHDVPVNWLVSDSQE
ncbi:5-formyltetrahydrofolate cyclo-ligase [Syntrophomonas palmitatica]|uniref:5-formyltetrahydrofolate cyclo-ligase n=1 Tax=Syntrophomonas palmitatica TaxID=402877 RepID=UPI0006D2A434|nr:5-formyltetrahydrofolate cyclo-ligase [Syntrophomonas palmitatica]